LFCSSIVGQAHRLPIPHGNRRGRLTIRASQQTPRFRTAILRILENGECRTVRSRSAQFAGQTWLSEKL
jgi:hypothetical protein